MCFGYRWGKLPARKVRGKEGVCVTFHATMDVMPSRAGFLLGLSVALLGLYGGK
jgi:hypothetical protein